MTRRAAKPTKRKKLEPLPCPWCGKKPDIEEYRGFQVECHTHTCTVMPLTVTCRTPEAAIRAWNRRRA